MSTTLSASRSPSIPGEAAELTAAFVAGFRSAKTRSNYTANLRDGFAWTETTGIGPCQVQRRVVEAYVGRLEETGYAPTRSASASPPFRASTAGWSRRTA